MRRWITRIVLAVVILVAMAAAWLHVAFLRPMDHYHRGQRDIYENVSRDRLSTIAHDVVQLVRRSGSATFYRRATGANPIAGPKR